MEFQSLLKEKNRKIWKPFKRLFHMDNITRMVTIYMDLVEEPSQQKITYKCKRVNSKTMKSMAMVGLLSFIKMDISHHIQVGGQTATNMDGEDMSCRTVCLMMHISSGMIHMYIQAILK